MARVFSLRSVVLGSVVLLLRSGSLLAQPGANDPTFSTGSGFDNYVTALAVQSNGDLIVGGWFLNYNGEVRNHLARLKPDGSLDADWHPGANSDVYATLPVSAGRMMVAGSFTSVGGSTRNGIARLLPTGAVDPQFLSGSGFNDQVTCLVEQPDGKILAGGYFTTYRGVSRPGIVRLNADGTLDATFDPGTGFGGGNFATNLRAIALRPDGRMVVVGEFTMFDGQPRTRIAGLNADGSIDGTFITGTGANSYSTSVVLRPDGGAIVGGDFTMCNGVQRDHVVLLGPDGVPDNSYASGAGFNGVGVSCLAMQPDGKVIAAGTFTAHGGITRNRLARLNTDGTIDLTFDPGEGANSSVNAMTLNPDGRVYIGGGFTEFGGTSAGRIARAQNSCVPGSVCDDGVAVTVDDIYGTDCVCAGTLIYPCIPSQLTTAADPVVTCGAVNLMLDGSSTIAATEVPGANKYQFRFTNITGQPAYSRNIAWPTRSFTLTKWSANPLKAGRTYNVQVRASFDNGGTWCDYGPSCTVKISWSQLAPGMMREGELSFAGDPELVLYPNPNNGVQLHLTLDGFDPSVERVSLDLYDLSGRAVMTRMLRASDGSVDQVLGLDGDIASGLYTVKVTAGEVSIIARLIVQR